MPPLGFEPRPLGLKGPPSAVELERHSSTAYGIRTRNALGGGLKGHWVYRSPNAAWRWHGESNSDFNLDRVACTDQYTMSPIVGGNRQCETSYLPTTVLTCCSAPRESCENRTHTSSFAAKHPQPVDQGLMSPATGPRQWSLRLYLGALSMPQRPWLEMVVPEGIEPPYLRFQHSANPSQLGHQCTVE